MEMQVRKQCCAEGPEFTLAGMWLERRGTQGDKVFRAFDQQVSKRRSPADRGYVGVGSGIADRGVL